MSYYLNRERMRVVERNERGAVKYRKSYKKGDKVDVSKMDEDHVARLVRRGSLVKSTDDLSEGQSAGGTSPTSPPFGAALSAPEDHEDLDPDGGQEADEADEDGDDGDEDDDDPAESTYDVPNEPTPSRTDSTPEGDVEPVDQYSEMDYAELQRAAKTRTGNGGGSAEELRARLRAADNE